MATDPKDKIIVSVDVSDLKPAESLIRQLSPYVGAFKIGLELITNCGAPHVVGSLQSKKAHIFFDGKFMDIPNTVRAASRAVTRLGVWMFNVHTFGGREMMEAARDAAESTAKASGIERPMVLGVTILTSLDIVSLKEVGLDAGDGLGDLVVRLALLAKASGLDGVVASPLEIGLIREACGPDFKIVTPGVRPSWAAADDQKRITTPRKAVMMGADYLVIGRPITRPPAEIGSPVDAAKKIAGEIV